MSKIRTVARMLAVFLSLFSFSMKAQDLDAHSPKSAPGSHQQRAADKKKLKKQKQAEKDLEKARKQHIKLQAKNTKKMMKKSKRKAEKWNNNK